MTFDMDPSVDNYCVMGNPVAHSQSPHIHKAFAEQTRQNIFYQTILVDAGKLEEAIKSFQVQGGKGLNITMPFKGEAWGVAEHVSLRAERALAVNTISFVNGQIIGDNTDGSGLIRDLSINHKLSIKDKKILILGAGGAVRGILDPLFDEEPDSMIIANRTVNRAEDLVNIFSDRGDISACGFDELAGKSFDIVINGTSASMQGIVPPIPGNILNENTFCYDMMYSIEDTAFVTWGKAHGAEKSLDGLGMLVEQAAESFFIWREIRPDTSKVIRMLREGLN